MCVCVLCVGADLLRSRAAAFHEVGLFKSSRLLFVCGCRLFGAVGFSVTGLLGWAAVFVKWNYNFEFASCLWLFFCRSQTCKDHAIVASRQGS